MSKIFDALMALAFLGVSLFGATTAYDFIRYAALKQVKHGLKSTYEFQKAIDGEHFDWER
jgi:hypothetical protein